MRLLLIILILSILFSLGVSAASFTITNFNANTAFRGESVQISVTINNPISSALTLKVSASDLTNNNTIISPGIFNDINLNGNEQKTFTFNLDIPEKVDLGNYQGSFTFTNNVNSSDSLMQSYTLKVDDRKLNATRLDRCINGIKGNLILKIKDPSKNEDFKPGDKIKIKVEVKNKGTTDLDVQVEAVLFDIDQNDDIARAKSEVKEVRDGSDDDFEFFVNVPTTEIDDKDKYILFIKAVEDPDRENLNCNEDLVDVDLKRKSSDVIIKKISMVPNTIECGNVLGVSLKIENIGKKDEDVSAKIHNELLGISKVANTFRLKNADRNEKDPRNEAVVNFDVNIPKDAKAGTYTIDGEVNFDGSNHKLGDDFFVICGQSKKEVQPVLLNEVKGNLVESNIEIKEGGSFSLAIKVTNDLNIKRIVKLEVHGIESFGDLISGDSLMQLNHGESRTGYFFINLKDNVKGKFSGTIDLISDTVVTNVPFNVNVVGLEAIEISYNIIVGIVIIFVVILLLLSGLINRKI